MTYGKSHLACERNIRYTNSGTVASSSGVSVPLCLCDVFRALINSLVCRFCTSALGLDPFQIVSNLENEFREWCFGEFTTDGLQPALHAKSSVIAGRTHTAASLTSALRLCHRIWSVSGKQKRKVFKERV